MRVKFWIIIPLILFLPVLAFSSTLDMLRISLIEGDVQIRTEETEEWVSASINMPLKEGDRIWVPEDGRVELQLRDGSFLRLDEQSALEVLTLERDSFQFYLTEGRAYINYRGLRDKVLQMDTPLASVRVFERARFRIDAIREGFTEISVYKGSVYAESQEGRTRVNEGKTLSIREGAYAEISPLGAPDEWERWNRERDRRVSARRPPQYLPEELHPYAYDFEENGRWVYVREYGYVWTPTVVISVGWAPYRIGRWVWIRGDYVWISYEPWGWVPYHYGRWAFIVNIGWCWVPPPRGAVFWGPGFVGWVYTPQYISWVPLAPGEIYYGYGYYGPHSVNITQVKHIDVHKVVYKNVHVHNAVTVVHRENFIKGRYEPVKVKENPFLRERISIGRPDIPPERELKIPMIKEIPHHKKPPEPIREIKVKEIKERRPLERKPEISVLRPGSRSEEMKPRTKERRTLEEREKERIEIKRPPEKGDMRPQSEPPKKVMERPIQSFPKNIEKIEKPRESVPTGKAQEKVSENRSLERGSRLEKTERGRERVKEAKPPEKEIEKEEPSKGERGGFGGRR